METKPFKETKVGEWLGKNVPAALSIVGDVLPSQGAFGIVKNIISSQVQMSAENKAEGIRLVEEHESAFLADVANARDREVKVTQATGKKDIVIMILAFFGIAFPTCIIGSILYFHPVIDALTAGFISTIMSGYILILGYYFGSSASSKSKDETISNLSK